MVHPLEIQPGEQVSQTAHSARAQLTWNVFQCLSIRRLVAAFIHQPAGGPESQFEILTLFNSRAAFGVFASRIVI